MSSQGPGALGRYCFFRFRVKHEVFPIAATDVVYCEPNAVREWEAGPDGLELLAFGGHADSDAEMQPGWWTD
jgi:hypothetical protein